MDFLLATNNKGKVMQFKELFKGVPNARFFTLSDVGIDIDVEENGQTFSENSLLKCTGILPYTDMIIIGEDGGICIDALNGMPGIYTARYASDLGKLGKLEYILDQLKDVSDKDRGAHFVSVITVMKPNGDYIQADGYCYGNISKDIVNLDGGMALTPIFVSKELNKHLSELTFSELISVNHRGNAARNILKKMPEFLGY